MPRRNVKNKPDLPKEGLENKGDAGEGLPKKVKKKTPAGAGVAAAAVKLLPRADATHPAKEKVCARRAETKGGGIVYPGNVAKELASALVSVAVPVVVSVGATVAVEKPNYDAAAGASVGETYDEQLTVGGGLREVTQRKKGQRKEGPKLLLVVIPSVIRWWRMPMLISPS